MSSRIEQARGWRHELGTTYPTERAVLEKLADALIPPAPGFLSATEAGVGDDLLAQATTYVPSLPALLRRVVATVR